MKTGIELIAEERVRQVAQEGWTPGHDDEHKRGELALAAACYACEDYDPQPTLTANPFKLAPSHWPWDWSWWKPKDHIRNLVRAGALIAAEIDRLQRAKESKE